MSIKKVVLRTLVLGAIAASATFAAKAETLDFTLTGPGTDITFTLPSSPTVTSPAYGDYFTVDNVVLDVSGHDITTDLTFYTKHDGGGFEADNKKTELFDLEGSALFTGSVYSPTFTTGDFSLTPYGEYESFSYCGDGGSSYNLSIVDPSAVTPEPSSVLLLATGIFALVGAGAAKRFAA